MDWNKKLFAPVEKLKFTKVVNLNYSKSLGSFGLMKLHFVVKFFQIAEM